MVVKSADRFYGSNYYEGTIVFAIIFGLRFIYLHQRWILSQVAVKSANRL